MKHTLFNGTGVGQPCTFGHRRLAESQAPPLTVKTIKSQQSGWARLIELCSDCFIRY